MNKEDRENIKQAVAEIIFGLTDNETLDRLKEYCTQSIKEALEESKQQGLRDIENAKEKCYMWAREASTHGEHIRVNLDKMRDIVSRGESACEEMKQAIGKYETTKRTANEVTNNAVIDGFECSICGCIVKNINVGGQWIKKIRFCPNCGGENIQYKQQPDRDEPPLSPFTPKKAGRRL